MSTVTILFTDVTGSVAALSAQGEERGTAEMTQHLSMIREIVGRHDGRIAKTLGDGVMAVFDSPSHALRAAIAIQQETERAARTDPTPLHVRIGLNCGEIITTDEGGEDVFGSSAVLARRLCDVATPDQILVPEVVRLLIGRRDDITLTTLEPKKLKGVPEPVTVHEVHWEPLPETLPPRVVVADDAALLRAGIVNLLAAAGFDVVADAVDHDTVIEAVERDRPDLLVTDIRMPPTHTDEGIDAAVELRTRHPELAVLVLSQYMEPRGALRLLDGATAGVGYVLKDRVTEVDEFLDACRTVLAGGTVIDPLVGEKAFARRRIEDVLSRLTDREREVLACMAQGAANPAIAERLLMSPKTVETHVRSIFQKLDLTEDTEGHRRVLAVLRFLDATK